jgi:hypothetical protein
LFSSLGLTESEIKEAFKSADVNTADTGIYLKNSNNDSKSSENIVLKIQDDKKISKKESIWSKIFRWIRNILVAGCLSYTAYEMLLKV